jgi:transposase
LEQAARQGKAPQKVACRARIVLMHANHEAPSSVADDLGVSRMTVHLWAARLVRNGVTGLLRRASRPGRRKQIRPENV